MPRALISLGSNLGDRSQTLTRAIERLAVLSQVAILDVSRFLQTTPVGGPAGQADFLNAAATLETSLSPLELLAALQENEETYGRRRNIRWDARTLDLDLLLFAEEKIATPDLVVPHPRMTFRRFVLEPAAEIAADWCLPESAWTIGELLANLDRRPFTVCIAGATREQRSVLADKLAACHDGIQVISNEQQEPTGSDPPTLLVLLDEHVSPFVDPPAVLRVETSNWPGVEMEATAAVLAMQ